MTTPDLIAMFVDPLERIGVRYVVTGGVATVIYGEPRFTRDIDLVLDMPGGDAPLLRSAFDPSLFYVPPVEVIEEEASRAEGGHFNIIHGDTALRADVYLTGDDPLHAWAFEHRRRIEAGAAGLWAAPPEYVIVRKLQYFAASGSDRHLRDVAMMLRVSAESIDERALSGWLDRLDLREPWDSARHYEIE